MGPDKVAVRLGLASLDLGSFLSLAAARGSSEVLDVGHNLVYVCAQLADVDDDAVLRVLSRANPRYHSSDYHIRTVIEFGALQTCANLVDFGNMLQ